MRKLFFLLVCLLFLVGCTTQKVEIRDPSGKISTTSVESKDGVISIAIQVQTSPRIYEKLDFEDQPIQITCWNESGKLTGGANLTLMYKSGYTVTEHPSTNVVFTRPDFIEYLPWSLRFDNGNYTCKLKPRFVYTVTRYVDGVQAFNYTYKECNFRNENGVLLSGIGSGVKLKFACENESKICRYERNPELTWGLREALIRSCFKYEENRHPFIEP